MDGIGKRGFERMFSAQPQGDAGKKKQVASDKPKPLDTAKAAANRAEVTKAKSSQDKAQERDVQNQTSSSKKEVIKTLEHAGKDKAQHSDVGSSSDSSKKVDILANFEPIGENTDLVNAKVTLLAESHISQHHQNTVDFIDTLAKDGDIVLIEGTQAGKEISKFSYAMKKALDLGCLSRDEIMRSKNANIKEMQEALKKWIEIGAIKEFKKDVKIYGWDNEEAHNEALRRESYMYTSKREDLNPEDLELLLKRDQSMIETINKMRKDFPDKKVFVISGEDHIVNSLEKIKGQDYIALSQKYNPTEKDIEDFLIRRLKAIE